jgi:hypothetical protein
MNLSLSILRCLEFWQVAKTAPPVHHSDVRLDIEFMSIQALVHSLSELEK